MARAKLSTFRPFQGPRSNAFTTVLSWFSGEASGDDIAKSTTTSNPVRVDIIEQVILLGLDDASLVGAPPPSRILVGDLSDLRKPDSIIVDRVGLRKLYPGQGWESAPIEKLRNEFFKEPRELE
jgi:hypothetical protein